MLADMTPPRSPLGGATTEAQLWPAALRVLAVSKRGDQAGSSRGPRPPRQAERAPIAAAIPRHRLGKRAYRSESALP